MLNCSTFSPSILDQLRAANGLPLALCGDLRLDGPILLSDEGLDLLLALHDHAQRRTLHAARGQAAADLLPQQRRQIEAHQVVQGAARLLGIHQIHGQIARVLDRLLDRAPRDLVKHHALHFLSLSSLLLFRISRRCQEMASPSRSGSVAR